MYKILIADDEEHIRKGIATVLSKMDYPLEIGEAQDGEVALKAILSGSPDIVLLDVRMPALTGTEVLEMSRKAGIGASFIIISGHSEFEYAQKALNYGAEGYLLKPVDPEKIHELIKLAIKKIDEAKRVTNLGIETEGLQREAELTKIERAVNQLVHAPLKHLETMPSLLPGLNEKFYQLSLIHLDGCNSNIWNKDSLGIETIKCDLKHALRNNSHYQDILVFCNQKNIQELFVLTAGKDQSQIREKTDRFLEQAVMEEKVKLKLSITIAVGAVAETIDKSLFESIRKMMDQRFEQGINRVYRMEHLKQLCDEATSDDCLKLLIQSINKSDYENIKVGLKDIFRVGMSPEKGKPVNVRRAYHEVLGVVSSLCSGRAINILQPPYEVDFAGDILDYLDNKTEVVNYLHTTIVNALNIEPLEAARCSNIIEMVVRYIDENYDRPLSVKEIAVQFAMNPNYFSSLFKKKTGQNFVEYINNKRIETSCRMLSRPNTSISGIAESLGFQDVQYFYKLFKKVTGVTPLEYRKQVFQDMDDLNRSIG